MMKNHNDEQLNSILDAISGIKQLNYSNRAMVAGHAGELDAIATSVNRLSRRLKLVDDNQKPTELFNQQIARQSVEPAQTRDVILNTLPVNISVLDKSGKIVFVNESWKIFGEQNGVPPDYHWLGINYIEISERAKGRDRITGKHIAKGIRDVLNKKTESFSIEYPCHSPTEERWFIAMVKRLEIQSGPAALVMHVNITERKLAEKRQLDLNNELELKVAERTLELTRLLEHEKEVNEQKSRFITLTSHEFRTPLSTMLTSIYLLEGFDKTKQYEKSARHFTRMKTAVANLEGILQNFFSVINLQSEKIVLDFKVFNVQKFLTDTLKEEKLILKQGQQFHFTYTGKKLVCQDKNILRVVLLNLLSNAIKFSKEGANIYLSAAVKNDHIILRIQDEGMGIPDEEQKNIFVMFYRAGNAANVQGTGLGLNIAKRYIELLNGNITFTSASGLGTTFTIELPLM